MNHSEALQLILKDPNVGCIASDQRYSNHCHVVYPFQICWTVFNNGSIRLNHVLQYNTRVGSMPRVNYEQGRKIGTGVIYWNAQWQKLPDADTFDVTHGDVGDLNVRLA